MAAVHPPGPRDASLELFSWPRSRLILWGTLLVVLCLGYFDRHTRLVVGDPVASTVAARLRRGVARLRALAQGLAPIAGRPGSARFATGAAGRRRGAARAWNGESLAAAAAGLLVLAAVSLITWAIWHDHAAVDGEPFSWTEGISVWPSVLIRLLVVVLGGIFVVNSLLRLKANQNELCPHFGMPREAHPPRWQMLPALRQRLAAIGLPTWRRVLPLHWADAVAELGPLDPPQPAPLTLFLHYCWLGHWSWRLVRVGLLTLLYLGFGLCLFFVHGFPNTPCRGGLCHGITEVVTVSPWWPCSHS